MYVVRRAASKRARFGILVEGSGDSRGSMHHARIRMSAMRLRFLGSGCTERRARSCPLHSVA